MKLENPIKLIILSSSRYCYVPELFSVALQKEELKLNLLNTLSEQLNIEIKNNSELGKQIRARVLKRLNLSQENERTCWENIFKKITNSKLNILNLGSSTRIHSPLEFINTKLTNLETVSINLELDKAEFERRCRLSLSKGHESNDESINRDLKNYMFDEINRQNAILEIQKNTKIEFTTIDALANEQNIIAQQLNNRL